MPATGQRKAYCKQGHPLQGDNVRIVEYGTQGRCQRICRKCENHRWEEHRNRTARKIPPNIRQVLESENAAGRTTQEIGNLLGVSRQRVHALMRVFGIRSNSRKRPGYWPGQPVEKRWLWKNIQAKSLGRELGQQLYDHLVNHIPSHCPILGLELDYTSPAYNGKKQSSYKPCNNSPSLDRIDNSKGYEIGNVAIISRKANTLKNDGTALQHERIAKYIRGALT